VSFEVELRARIARTVDKTVRDLKASNRWRAGTEAPALEVPRAYWAQLKRVADIEAGEGGQAQIDTLLFQYGEMLPMLRVTQLGASDEPGASLFHTPLDWSGLPRLKGGLDRLLGEEGAQQRLARCSTVAELFETCCFGGFSPMLYAYPHDLQSYAEEVARDGIPAVVDRRLSAALLHEVAHFGRDRAPLFPPILDESLAGYLSAVALPQVIFPDPGDDNAFYGAPWFLQIAQALAATIGHEALVAAHTEQALWSEVLPPGLMPTLERLGDDLYRRHRGVHLLDGNTAPGPWQKLLYLAAAEHAKGGRADFGSLTLESLETMPWADIDVEAVPERPQIDGQMAEWALASMTLWPALEQYSYRIRRRLPPTPVVLDTVTCRVHRSLAEDETLDPAPPSYLFPPRACARLRARGVLEVPVVIDDLHGLGTLAEQLLDAAN